MRAFWWIPLLGFLGFIYWKFDPDTFGIFPKCPFFVLTGYKCAGCGSQRAVHHLLQGDIGSAWDYNPMLVAAIPYLLVGFYLEYGGGKRRHPRSAAYLVGKPAIYFWGIVLTGWWVVRNLLDF